MFHGMREQACKTSITERLCNLKKSSEPFLEFSEILQDVQKMRNTEKDEAIKQLHDHILTAIDELEGLSQMESFYYGVIGKRQSEAWISLAVNKDPQLKKVGIKLDKALKGKVIGIVVSELQEITKNIPEIKPFDSSSLTFDEAMDMLMSSYVIRVKSSRNHNEVWQVTQDLVYAKQASIVKLSSPAFPREYSHIHEECGGIKYVHIFNKKLSNLIFKKFEELHAKDFSNCDSKEEAIRLFYEYPVIKQHISAMSDRFDQIQQNWA